MRRLNYLFLAVAAVMLWPVLASGAGVKNTKHDLSSGSTAAVKATDTDEVCIFCHTPHRAQTEARRPLWNHELTITNLTWTPTTTTRGTTLPTDVTGTALFGSRACLSCHDGTIALGSVLIYYDQTTNSSGAKTFNVTGPNVTTGKLTSGSSAFINTAQMEDNHPVGVVRPADKAGFTPFNPTPTNDVNGVDYDQNGYVQCGSCHNPHLYDLYQKPFLRKSNAASAICLTCHALQ